MEEEGEELIYHKTRDVTEKKKIRPGTKKKFSQMEGVVDEEGNRSPGGVGESLDTQRPRSLKSRGQEESLVWR